MNLSIRHRPPSVYLLLVALTAAQLGIFVLSGTLSHVSARGSEIMMVLLVALGFRSRIVWALLVLMNAVQLLAVVVAPLIDFTSSGSGHIVWGHILVMLITGVALEATLLSSAMRQFVGRRREPRGTSWARA